MDEIVEILRKYFIEKDIINLKNTLKEKQRGTTINDKYFAKVGKNSDKLFFNNLVKEIYLYKSNQNNLLIPNFIDSYISDQYCLIILEKINGKVLSTNRNEFNLHLSQRKRLEISKCILDIKNIKLKHIFEKNL